MENNLESEKLKLTAAEAVQISNCRRITTINAALYIIINAAGERQRRVNVTSVDESVRHDLTQKGFIIADYSGHVTISW